MTKSRGLFYAACLLFFAGSIFFQETAHAAYASWTDGNLDNTKRIRKAHIDEIVARISEQYTRCLVLPTPAYASGVNVIVAGVSIISISHYNDLRTSINTLYSQANGGTPYPFSAAPTAGGVIRAFYFNELRAAIDAIHSMPGANICPNPTQYYCTGAAAPCTSTTAYTNAATCLAGVGKPCYSTQGACDAQRAVNCPPVAGTFYYCTNSTTCTSGSYADAATCSAANTGKSCFADPGGNAVCLGNPSITTECPACNSNNTADPGEPCDGTDLRGETCVSQGKKGGSLACSSCAFDKTGCTNCGEGNIDAGEECDDGNTVSGDGCSATCNNEVTPRCGDGIQQAGEDCEFTPPVPVGVTPTANSSCDAACHGIHRCGDGVPDFAFGEECDNDVSIAPAAPVGGDGCNSTCRNESAPRCGDGVINQALEQCDNDVSVAPALPILNPPTDCCDSLCRTSLAGGCTAPRCGDGNRDVTEACDDGNTANGDGCSDDCQNENAKTGSCVMCGMITGCAPSDPDPFGQNCCPGTSRQYVQAPPAMCAPCSSYCTQPGYTCVATPAGDVCAPPAACSTVTQTCNGAPGSSSTWSSGCGGSNGGGCPGISTGSCNCVVDGGGCNICTYTASSCQQDASCTAGLPGGCPSGQCAWFFSGSWGCYACGT